MKLNELIKELCPNGVEYRTLGEVAKVTSGSSAPQASSDFSKNGIPFCRTSDVGKIHLSVDFNEIADRITETAARKMNLMPKGTILIPKSGASTLLNHKVRLSIDSYVVSHLAAVIPNKKIINDRFLYYVLTCFDMCQLVEDKSYPSVKTSDIASKIQIPVPPLPVQEEIVRILDSFTKLTAELTAELTARRKQYEYYRDALLTRERSETKWKELQEIAEIGTGSCNTNEAEENGTYPFYVRSPEVLRKNTFEYDETAIITAGDGVGVGKVFHYVEGKYALHQRAYRIHITDKTVLPRYYFHYMKATFLNYISKEQFKASVQSIRRPMLNKYPVPIPPFDVQERIVNVLDNFDAICSDLKIGLPAEIEARKKQYEYYRDLLLTFAERGNTIFTEQNRTEQNRTEQNRTEQMK